MAYPVEVHCVRDHQREGDAAYCSLHGEAGGHSNSSDEQANDSGPHHEPDPAAVVRDEVDSGLIHHLILSFDEHVFVVEGTDDVAASEDFLPVRVDWGPHGLCDFVQLVVSRQVRSCLLYTSPSPRDLSTSRMPSSA